MSGSSSTPQQQVVQTQTNAPWSGAQPFLEQTMSSAAGLYNQGMAGSYAPYPGSVLGPVHPWQEAGQNWAKSLAESEPFGSANLTSARNYMGNLITNEGLTQNLRDTAGKFGDIYNRVSGDQNPYLQGVINQQMDKVNAAMSGAGRYGSGMHEAGIAQAIAPTLAQDWTQRQQMAQQAAGALGDIYGQGLQRAGAAAQLTPTLDAARFANADIMTGLGQYYTNRAQTDKDADIARWNAQQAYPWESLNRFNAIIGGAGGLGSSRVTTGQAPQQPSTLQRILGGGLAGAGMGSMFGPMGAGIGAVGGGLLGMM